ncbi:MAG: hypothetical protein ACK5KM_06565, partial [Hyphomicrobiaceae bacterium]
MKRFKQQKTMRIRNTFTCVAKKIEVIVILHVNKIEELAHIFFVRTDSSYSNLRGRERKMATVRKTAKKKAPAKKAAAKRAPAKKKVVAKRKVAAKAKKAPAKRKAP